ncbi:MAG: hypothetical protein B7X06_03750, partial [Verrucomicrobia bacterium 21-51-4]
RTSAHTTELTLTIYLVGFACGVAIWGILSDAWGRKPILLIGITLYILGSIACWNAHSIEALLVFRFIQALGGSAGSVLGQAIARDAIPIEERTRSYASISMAMAFSPAIGPVIGGITDHLFGWEAVFGMLTILGISTALCIARYLPETHLHRRPLSQHPWKEAFGILKDKRVLTYGWLVAGCNGIIFSFYAEGPFYYIRTLGLTPSVYGILALGIAAPLFLGASYSRWLLSKNQSPHRIIRIGCLSMCIGSAILALSIYTGLISPEHPMQAIITSSACFAWVFFGIPMLISNSLSHALEPYKHLAGTAASLFGASYYAMISALTGIMAWVQNGTLLPMPTLFMLISLGMLAMHSYVFNTSQASASP